MVFLNIVLWSSLGVCLLSDGVDAFEYEKYIDRRKTHGVEGRSLFTRVDANLVWVKCQESYDFVSRVRIPVHVVNKCKRDHKEKKLPKSVINYYAVPNL